MKLWQVGLLLFIFAGLLNTLLIQYQLGGLVPEMMRLLILTGLGILIFGMIKRK